MANTLRNGTASSSIARAMSWRACAVVSAGLFLPPQTQPDQEQMRREGVGHMMMPTRPGAGVIMIQADFTFPFFQRGLHRPAHSTDADKFTPRAGRGGIAEVKLDLWLRSQCASEDQPNPWAWQSFPNRGRTQKCELGHQGALATFLDNPAHPLRFRQVAYQVSYFTGARYIPRHSRACSPRSQETSALGLHRWRVQPHSRVRRHFDQIPFAEAINFLHKTRAFSIGFIGRHPAKGDHRALHCVGHHVQCQFRFSLEAHVLRYPTGLPALAILVGKPAFREIQPFIQERIAARTGVDQKHTLLTIRDFFQMTTVLIGDPDRARSLFGKTTPIRNHHAVGFAQVRDDQLMLMFPHPASIPGAFRHKALGGAHGFWVGPVQGQHHRFNRLALKVRQLPTQIKQRPLTLFTPIEAIVKQVVKGDQLLGTGVNVLRQQLGRGWLPTGWWPNTMAAFGTRYFGAHGRLLWSEVANECNP